MELLFHAQESGSLSLLQTHYGNPSPATDDEGDFLLAENWPVRLAMLLPLFLFAANVALQLPLAIPQRSSALEVLIANSRLLVDVDRIELSFQLGDCGRWCLRRESRTR